MRLFIALGVIATLVSGCTVRGQWKVDGVYPPEAARDFQIRVLHLEANGVYHSVVDRGALEIKSGYYYDLQQDVLYLAELNGPTSTYFIEHLDGESMQLARYGPEPYSVVFVRDND